MMNDERRSEGVETTVMGPTFVRGQKVEMLNAVKKKVGIVVGYVGSKYYGIQENLGVPSDSNLKTIEYIVRRAIYDSGFMLETNYEDPSKVAWSRASRTDKGVHAAMNLIALKMEVEDRSWNKDGQFNHIRTALNSNLPSDIRVFSVFRVPRPFNARHGISNREYEYLLPLHDDNFKRDLDIILLREALANVVGVHSFHNFTSEKETRSLNNSRPISFHKFKLPTATENPKIRRNILRLDVSDIMVCSNTQTPYIKITICGQSFLYNQIRLMIGAAIATSLKLVPSSFIPAALSCASKVKVPLAPANGLLLNNLTAEARNKLQMSPIELPSGSLIYERRALSLQNWMELTAFKENQIYPEIMGEISKNNFSVFYSNLQDGVRNQQYKTDLLLADYDNLLKKNMNTRILKY